MRVVALTVAVVTLLVAQADRVLAQPATATKSVVQRRARAVSVGTWSMSGFAGLQGQYEAQLESRRHWSWIAGGGFRFSARGDFSSSTLAAGGEARYWINRRAVWAHAAPGSMIGWFVGARLDLAWTRTRDDMDDRTIGNNMATALTATAGYRFLIRGTVEATPMVGIGANRDTDLGGRLPGMTRPMGRLGMTLGWMF